MDNLNRPQIEHLSDREVLLLTAQNVVGINARLDKLNGSVAQTKERVDELEKWKCSVEGVFTTGKVVLGSGGLIGLIALYLGWIKL